MFVVRLKLPDLMQTAGLRNAYALMKASKGELTITTATRLVKADGKPKRIDMDTLDTLCRIFGVKNMNDLFERDDVPATTPPRKKRRQAA